MTQTISLTNVLLKNFSLEEISSAVTFFQPHLNANLTWEKFAGTMHMCGSILV